MRILTCGGGAPWEVAWVRAFKRRELGVEVTRRCVDHGELLGVALRELPRAVLVTAELPWLDRDLVGALQEVGVTVVAVENVPGLRPLEQMGITHRVDRDTEVERVVELLVSLGPGVGAEASGSRRGGGGDHGAARGAEPAGLAQGALVAVWGAAGAPGRTAVATHLAIDLAARGRSVLLVDGDCWSASVAQLLGIPESPSVTKAARLAADGWPEPLSSCVHPGPRGVRVLTGLPRADLWPEIRDRSWLAVLDRARSEAELVVVDVAAPIEEDEELSFDRVPYRRNLMTRVALREADRVVVVADAAPLGLRRAIFAHRQLRTELPRAAERSELVCNRAPSNDGLRRQLAAELERWCGVTPSGFLSRERAFERAAWEGLPLHEAAPRSHWLRELRSLGLVEDLARAPVAAVGRVVPRRVPGIDAVPVAARGAAVSGDEWMFRI